ncbi:glycosyltransferase [Lithospermum erythrorhizon]|uniref:Glycosyltransferase n=1 Tax=Lithospermum erythrorhizon TaxID=34254 RepID=A0AAV3P5E0_LITER
MLPSSYSHAPTSSSQETLKKPKSNTFSNTLQQSCNSLQTHITTHPRFYLFTSFFFIQIIVFYLTHNTPFSISFSITTITHPTPTNNAIHDVAFEDEHVSNNDPQCPSGRVYIYEMPSFFNKDLVMTTCDDLDPWKWQCGIVSNHGFGKPALELFGFLPENISPAWYRTNQFSLELIFHHRMMNYKCRTLKPEFATAYYIPFYAGLAVGKYLWINDTSKRDYHGNEMLKWVKTQKYFKKSNGSDHFMTLGRITWDFRRLKDPEEKWGSSLLNMHEMQRITRLIIEKAPTEYEDIGVPYPTGFHPRSLTQLQEWQKFVRAQNRTTLFTFIGATRGTIDNDLRSYLLSYCYNESDSCRLVDCGVVSCSNGSLEIFKALLSSDFCLQPKGDSFTRRSVFDCMLAGSVPVFFWRQTGYDQYEWYLPGEPESYSIFISHEDVRNGLSIKRILEGYNREEVRKMREKVVEIIPKIVYSWNGKGLRNVKDAFDVAVEGVLNRISLEKEWN